MCRLSGWSLSIAAIPAAHDPAPVGVANTLLTEVTVQPMRSKIADFILSKTLLPKVTIPFCAVYVRCSIAPENVKRDDGLTVNPIVVTQ